MPVGPSSSRQNYFGSHLGKLLNRGPHQVSGEVYAVDEQTLFIRRLNYDGLAPDAYFWSSPLGASSPTDGFIVPDEKGSTKPLERYANKDVVLRLPEGKTLREIQWLSIWSRQLKSSAGDIQIAHQSGQFVIPRPLEIGPFSQLAHGLKSGPITIVDAQTFLVPDFHYDGLGPDAYFWLTRGTSGLSGDNSVKLRDENGSAAPLRKYQGETVVISLPDELTIYDFDFFGVWCRQFAANFGQVSIPQLSRVPPSPKMLGIKPENKLNCEILYDDLGFEIRWVLDGDDIVMQLVGKIEPDEYMAFGLGKDDSKSDMNNADAVVAWVERQTGQVQAIDYFLGAKQQCKQTSQGSYSGSCPDVKLKGGTDSLTLLHGAIVNGYSMVTFKRPQLGVDEQLDQHVYSDGQQSVIWAIGSLNANKEIGYHRLRTKTSMFIDFARNPQWNCPVPDLNASMHNNLPLTSASQLDQTVVSAAGGEQGGAQQASAARLEAGGEGGARPWFIPQVLCPMERTFYAQLGPTAGTKGYAGLTGRAGSWLPPVSWYINGLLIPELVVERGQAYRFIVEGGNDKLSSNRRHPLYLTDSPDGGFNFKTDEERARERIYGGVAMRASDGQFVPTAEGRLCEWRQTNQTLADPDQYATFSAYQRTLKLDCLPGQASMLKFVPDANTPDTIYYQSYTSRLMGWRVRVVDSCSAYQNSLLQAGGQRTASTSNVSNEPPRS